MRYRKRKTQLANPSRFAHWLLNQVDQNHTTLTELGERAGLSRGTLRGIVFTPERQPTLDTCLRLANLLQVPSRVVLDVADLHPNLSSPESDQLLDLDRAELFRLYAQLAGPAQRILLDLARSLAANHSV